MRWLVHLCYWSNRPGNPVWLSYLSSIWHAVTRFVVTTFIENNGAKVSHKIKQAMLGCCRLKISGDNLPRIQPNRTGYRPAVKSHYSQCRHVTSNFSVNCRLHIPSHIYMYNITTQSTPITITAIQLCQTILLVCWTIPPSMQNRASYVVRRFLLTKYYLEWVWTTDNEAKQHGHRDGAQSQEMTR